MLEPLAYALGLKFRENTFVYYPAVQLDGNRVSNDVAEKGRRIFAFSLAQVAVLHSGYALIGIKGFDLFMSVLGGIERLDKDLVSTKTC